MEKTQKMPKPIAVALGSLT